jgi:flagellar protein FliO/FliZ
VRSRDAVVFEFTGMFSLFHLPRGSSRAPGATSPRILHTCAAGPGFLAPVRIGAGVGGTPRVTRFLVLLIVFAFVVSAALGADDDQVIFPGGGARGEAPAAARGSVVNTVTLVAALALAGVGGWLVWRNRRGTPLARTQRALAIDETRSLGNRQYLVVASYEGRKFLLGVCPGRISLLSRLSAADDDDEDAAP